MSRASTARRTGPPVPTLRRERRLWNEGHRLIVGVDEVGVAPTCGAVVAAAVIMREGCHRIPGVRDSKTLSMVQRERLAPIIRKRALAIGIGAASVTEIDRLNIYHATHLAMRRAVARVGPHDHVLVDGRRIFGFEEHAGPYTAIIDGDALCYSISCASIVAKVVRDRLMAKLAARYPWYGWEHNRGYSSPDHRRAIAAHGVTPHHRRSFATVREALYGEQSALGLLGDAFAPPLEEPPIEEPPMDSRDAVAVAIEPEALRAVMIDVEAEAALSPP
ncbi:MAG: ribonuclease HII [Chloroflexi bacterium]|nr:ribonuclease HII [Chloroflexota bacterium]HEV8054177.1 ribonuclease HII [Candidatus Limnocylindrales bacterium]